MATDLETVLLHRLYVLFFIEIGSRRAWITGVTPHPNAAWVTQQARNVAGDFADAGIDPKFPIRDRDTKYVANFDEAFRSERTQNLKTPFRTPNANAYAERFVRPSGQSAWIICSSSMDGISNASFGVTPSITTNITRTRDYPKRFLHHRCRLPWRRRLSNLRTPTGYMFVDATG